MNYIIQNKNNIQSLYIVSLLLFLFILPNITLADNLYGQTCGNRTCSQDEVCQKQYRGVLPIGPQNTGNATYTCVKPQAIEAPESPYKGEIGCGEGPGGLGSNFANSITGGILGGSFTSNLGNLAGDFLGDLASPRGFDFSGNILNTFTDPIGAFTGNFTDLIGLENLLEDCSYNNINGVIDTRRLIAPLPVDLFNPLPLPVNVTSPTPLPVVVVDDLALYQQKELIDAPLAAQQKAKTIATVSDTLRYEISSQDYIPQNLDDLRKLGIQFGALDSETGVVAKDAIDTYGSYANFSLDKNNELAQYFRDLQDPTKSQLPRETFTGKCGNIKVEEADTLDCIVEGLKTPNNINDIATTTAFMASQKSDEARTQLEQEVVVMGDGYFSKTENNNKNPFTKVIQTPGSNISSLSEKVTEATIDQAILASGDNCFEAIPKNILDGTLKPVLTQGLYGVNNTLSSVLNNATTNPVNTLQNPQALAIQLKDSTTNQFNPDRFFRSLQDSLVQNVTDGLSCELNKQISGLLNGIIGNVTLPGIGNVNSLITNTVSNGVNNLVQDGVNNIIR